MMTSPSPGKKKSARSDKTFRVQDVFTAFAGLPRVFHLVWSASPFLTLGMAVMTMVNGLIPLANAIIARLLLDSVIHAFIHHTFMSIWLPITLQLAVNVLNALFDTLHLLLSALLQDRTEDYIQLLILRKADVLDLAFFEQPEFHAKLQHVTEEARSKPLQIVRQTFNMARGLITLFSLFGLLLSLGWWIIPVVILIPLPSFIADSSYGFKDYWLTRRQSAEKLMQLYVNRVMVSDEFAKEVKLFNLGDFFIRRYQDLAEKFYHENKNLHLPRNIIGFLWSMPSLLANAGIYVYIALQAVSGAISFGALSQYTMAVTQVGYSVKGTLNDIASLYENSLFAQTVFDFLTYQPAVTSPIQPSPLQLCSETRGLDIEFRNVSFTYPGRQQPGLNHANFTLRAGETIAVVGHNGAGKTTLVKLLTRLYDPDEGEILIGGRNIKEYDLTALREQFSVIFQDFVKYVLSAQENIGVGNTKDILNLDLIMAAAQKSGADGAINKLKDGYAAMLGKWVVKGEQLSGGEWQKVALARAFFRDARVLILDEPTSALDAQAEYDMFARLLQLMEGKTTLFISHRFSTARLADRIFVLEDGRVAECGSHDELMEKNGTYARLFHLQAMAYR
jgi:ATP-binding cassette subfamily B protein